MLILIGEFASGKSAIQKSLIEDFGFQNAVTYTTRPRQNGELDGKHHYFINEDTFQILENEQFFFETSKDGQWSYGGALIDYQEKELCNKVGIATPHGLRQLHRCQEINIFSVYLDIPAKDRIIKALMYEDDIEKIFCRNLRQTGEYEGISQEVDMVVKNQGYEKPTIMLAKGIKDAYERLKDA